jgi:gliding motility-associated-like protein
MRKISILLLIFLVIHFSSEAQFTPISLSGFTQDVVAEAGPNPVATTTMEIDGLTSSNKVLYSASFASFASIAGGLPDNGTLINGADNYQLASYTGNNALFVKRNETFELTATTPSSFAKIRLLAFSAEGASTLNISLGFSDGTYTPYLSNNVIGDWFNGTSNIVAQGMGRITRTSAGPWVADGIAGNNPRLYYIEIILNCTDRSKLLQKIRINNISTNSNAPFPNAVVMAASGIPFTQTIIPAITASDCNGPNGSIALNVSGSAAPYTFSWNTTPMQTSSSATNLAPGNYTCTITDAAGCTSSFNATVSLNNNATITATATPVAICNGGSTQLEVVAGNGVLTDFTWTPGPQTGATQTVSPSVTTTYVVTATNALGCSAASQITVTVQNKPATPVANAVAVCSGASATLTVNNPNPSFTYKWYDLATGGTSIYTGNFYTVNNATTAATYYVEAISSAGCVSDSRALAALTVNPNPSVALLSDTSVCPGTDALLRVKNSMDPLIDYQWFPTATGGAPVATGYSFNVVGVSAPSTWYAEAITTAGCKSANRAPVQITLIAQLATPVATVTNIAFSSLTFSWAAVTGATGYLVSVDGGNNFIVPSAGGSGLSHTVDNLPGNTTVAILVKATGLHPCETSVVAGPVAGTTLSTREIFVPNVFTPNGDGKNDVLKVFGNYIATIDLRIFNPWGQLIFQTTDPAIGWDGKHKGQLQPVGVYAYALKVTRQDGTIVTKKGSINLIH